MRLWLTKYTPLMFIFMLCNVHSVAADDMADCISGDIDRVLASCTRLIERGNLDKNDRAVAHNNRGMALSKFGLFDDAIEDFNAAIVYIPDNAGIYTNRGNAFVQKGRLDDADTDFTRAIQLNPLHAEAFSGRALARFLLNRSPQALSDINQAIQLKPGCALNYNNRGVIHNEMGHREKAIADYQKALKLDPSLKIAIENLADLTSGVSVSHKFGDRSRKGQIAPGLKIIPQSNCSFLGIKR